jgi:hypothetical protein
MRTSDVPAGPGLHFASRRLYAGCGMAVPGLWAPQFGEVGIRRM